mmetsp:Transcript_6621/g.9179  ORF Transcript_6621/g.9179 Transcript_6621/m.9179 type:complete len:344 (-) Transcript_6621:552-1583(-)
MSSSRPAPIQTTSMLTAGELHQQQAQPSFYQQMKKKKNNEQQEEVEGDCHRELRKKEKNKQNHQSQATMMMMMMNVTGTAITTSALAEEQVVVSDKASTAHKGKWPLSRVTLQGQCFQHISATMLSFLSTKERHVVQRVCKMWASRFSFSKATALNLSGVYTLTNQQFSKLVALYPGLKTVSLRGCRKLTDDALKTLADTQSKTVESVDLSRLPKISNDGLELLESCQELRTLSVASCANITKSGVQNLANMCPKLVPPIIVPTLTRQRGIYWMRTSRRPLEPMPSQNTTAAAAAATAATAATDMMGMFQFEKASSPPEDPVILPTQLPSFGMQRSSFFTRDF